MSTERQLQDRGKSAQEDSLGIEDARKIAAQTIVPNLTTDSDSQDDQEHLQRVELLTKKLQEDLNSVDTNAIAD